MNAETAVHVVGAGGHAKVVIAALQAACVVVEAAWDDDARRVGGEILGIPIRGPIEGVPPRASVVIAIGANACRKAVASRLSGRTSVRVIHPAAIIHPSAVLGAGTVVFAGAVVQPDVRLGEHVIVNTAASVDHDCIVGDFVHIAPGAHLAGGVRIREGALLGIGACAVPGAEIGSWAVVGAGGVVVAPIAAGVTAVGCPARTIERMTVEG